MKYTSPMGFGELSYDPFGSVLVDRNWSSGSEYRYGFNSQEQDEEIYGKGNFNIAEYWAYDCRLGRRLNVDPKGIPTESPYATFRNNPILVTDVNGDWPGIISPTLFSPLIQIANYYVQVPGGEDDEYVKIISRKEWGARDPQTGATYSYEKITTSLKVYYTGIVIHHAGNSGTYTTVQEVQDKHMDESGKADIGYHFAIDKEGNIYEGRPIDIKGAHVDKANTGRIGIVLLADLDTEDECLNFFQDAMELEDGELNSEMEISLLLLIDDLNQKYGIEYLNGHGEINCGRACPGDLVEVKLDEWREETGTSSDECVTEEECGSGD